MQELIVWGKGEVGGVKDETLVTLASPQSKRTLISGKR